MPGTLTNHSFSIIFFIWWFDIILIDTGKKILAKFLQYLLKGILFITIIFYMYQAIYRMIIMANLHYNLFRISHTIKLIIIILNLLYFQLNPKIRIIINGIHKYMADYERHRLKRFSQIITIIWFGFNHFNYN